MRGSLTSAGVAVAALACAAQLIAGGFWLQLGNPEASAEARAMNAVLTVRPVGCHQPEKAAVTGTAIGVVNGRRQSIPLKLTALSAPAMYALTRQWPAEGTWVVELIATNDAAVTSALVAVNSNGFDRKTAKFAMGKPTAEQVEAFLRATSGPAAVARK